MAVQVRGCCSGDLIILEPAAIRKSEDDGLQSSSASGLQRQFVSAPGNVSATHVHVGCFICANAAAETRDLASWNENHDWHL